MKIIQIWPKLFSANAYVVTCDGKNGIAIDLPSDTAVDEIMKKGVNVCDAFLTHCHYDHTGGAEKFCVGGGKIYCSKEEKELIGTGADLYDLVGTPRPNYSVYKTFTDGEEISLYGMKIRCILTSGHTDGSMTYLFTDETTGEQALFTGDTLFEDSVGRTDFPTGNYGKLQRSLQKLTEFCDSMPVYSGHGDMTTIGREKACNLFIERNSEV